MREELLGVGERIVKRALELGFDEAAVRVTFRDATMVKFANSEPSVAQSWKDRSVDVYVAKDKRILGTSGSVSSIGEVEEILGRLRALASRIPESMLYAPLPEPSKVDFMEGLVDRRILEAISDPSDVSELIVEAVHRRSVDYFAGMFEASYTAKALVTSTGTSLYEDATGIQAYVRVFAGDGSGQWSLGSRRLDEKRIEEMAEIAARYAVEAKNPVDVEPGTYNIVLSPMVAGNLMNYVARMASAMSVMMGMSIFAQKKPGEKVASEKLTLIDDPRNPELPYSWSFDDEGVPTYSKPIIERGVFRTLLHNSKTAAKMGAKTTGNAGLLHPHPWSLSVAPGDRSLEELIEEAGDGFLVTNNWYTRLQNYVEGTFSTITRDAVLIIKRGEIAGAAKKFRIADSFPRMLSNLAALTRERYDMYWWEVKPPTRIPYMLFRDVHTSKHTG